MTRDGAIEVNETQQTTQRISQREQDADFQKTPEQQAAQDAAAQLDPTPTDAAPLPRLPVTPAKKDAATTERVMEHIGGAQTRKASKKAVQKAQRESAAGARSSRLQFTDEERATPELGKYIEKSDKAADRLDAARAAIPKEKKLVRERSFDEATGKGKTRLRFEEYDKPPGFKEKHSPLSRPAQEAGIFVHNKVHSVEKDNSGVEGAHKSEEAAEKGLKYGARKVREGYRNHKLKPYRAAAKAERAAEKANVNYLYQKALQDNPQIAASNPASRFMQKQRIKRQYAKAMKKGGAAAAAKAAENTRRAAKKTAEETKKTVSPEIRLWWTLQSHRLATWAATPIGAGTALMGAWSGAPVSFRGATIRWACPSRALLAARPAVWGGLPHTGNGATGTIPTLPPATRFSLIGTTPATPTM